MRSRPTPRATIDTNLFVSALITPRGLPGLLLRAWERGEFVVVTSPALVTELEAVLARDKLRARYFLSPEAVGRLVGRLRYVAEQAAVPADLPIHSRDPNDDKFLAAALGGGADFLVTGDEDLLVLDGEPALGRLRIATAREFLELLRTGG